jgi:hypothetical protein
MSESFATVSVKYKEGNIPYFEDTDLTVVREDMYRSRERGRIIYVSGRLVQDGKVIFKRVPPVAAVLENAQMVQTEKGTLVIKYVPGSILYVLEVPSGFRGDAIVSVEKPCITTTILRSQRGSLGEVAHVWVNGGNCKVRYKITGRTGTAGYEYLPRLFGENLEGEIVLENGHVTVIFDDELRKILEGSA